VATSLREEASGRVTFTRTADSSAPASAATTLLDAVTTSVRETSAAENQNDPVTRSNVRVVVVVVLVEEREEDVDDCVEAVVGELVETLDDEVLGVEPPPVVDELLTELEPVLDVDVAEVKDVREVADESVVDVEVSVESDELVLVALDKLVLVDVVLLSDVRVLSEDRVVTEVDEVVCEDAVVSVLMLLRVLCVLTEV